MIDPEILEKNPIAKEAFKLLWQSGVMRQQIEAERNRLLAGDADENLTAVAQSIKEFRRKAGMLESFHQLGEEFHKKEKYSE